MVWCLPRLLRLKVLRRSRRDSLSPLTAETLFRIGSVSKSFAALAALKLQEEGKLKLTDTVRQWVPEVAFTNPWEATDPVRLVHLMEHTTGFPLPLLVCVAIGGCPFRSDSFAGRISRPPRLPCCRMLTAGG